MGANFGNIHTLRKITFVSRTSFMSHEVYCYAKYVWVINNCSFPCGFTFVGVEWRRRGVVYGLRNEEK